MKRNDKGRGKAHQHMNVEPVARRAFLAEPGPVFAEGIQKNSNEKRDANEPQIKPDRAARPQQMVLGREGAVHRRQFVVIKAINKNGQIAGDGQRVEGIEPDLVASLQASGRVRTIRYCSSDSSAHFLITCSSVLTENFL